MRRERAMALFEEGYNCAQSVFLAFSDLHGMDTHMAAALSSFSAVEWEDCARCAERSAGCFWWQAYYTAMTTQVPGRKKRHTMRESRNWRKAFEEKNGSDCLSGLLALIGKAGKTDAEGTDCRVLYKSAPARNLSGTPLRYWKSILQNIQWDERLEKRGTVR